MTSEEFVPGIFSRVRPGHDEWVLWIHGYTVDSSVWDAIWQELPGWGHIGIDLPGHGRSRSFGEGDDLAAFGHRVAEAAVARGVRHIVGLSLGSVIALQVALDQREAFASLTLAAPALGGGPNDPGAAQRYRELDVLYRSLGPGNWMTTLWMSSPPQIFTYARDRPDLWAQLVSVIDRHSWEELGRGSGITRIARETQAVESLARLGARTLILVGEHEMPAYTRTAEMVRSHAPDASVVELAGAGHLCILESPVESARHIDRHLRGNPAR